MNFTTNHFYKYKGKPHDFWGYDMVYKFIGHNGCQYIFQDYRGNTAAFTSTVDNRINDNFIQSGVQEINWINNEEKKASRVVYEYNPVCVKQDLPDDYFENHDLQEKVNHPSHYTWLKDLCGIEVIDIVRHMDFDLGNAIKYILRCGHKSEKGYTNKEKTIEDLRKAIFYIEDKINTLKDS